MRNEMSLKPEIFELCMGLQANVVTMAKSLGVGSDGKLSVQLAVSVHEYLKLKAELEKLRTLAFEKKMQECEAAKAECERIYAEIKRNEEK